MSENSFGNIRLTSTRASATQVTARTNDVTSTFSTAYFGPRVTELLDRLQKAAGVNERPMTMGDLDILAAASWELLTTTLANMPESQRGKRVRQLSETLAAAVAKKRERLEQKIGGRLDALRQAPLEDM